MNDIPKVAKKRLTYNEEASLNKSSYKKYEPKHREYFVRDTKLEGFSIRVFTSGTKSYVVRARKGGVGSPKQITIGKCGIVDFDEAKETAKVYIKAIRYEGITPKEALRKEARKDKTIMSLVEDYVDLRKNKLAEYTKLDYKRRVKNRLGRLCLIPVTEITQDDIIKWWKKCPQTRSDGIAFQYARKVCSVAMAQQYISVNPFINAKEIIGELPKIKERDTLVTKPELYDFLHTLIDISPKIKKTIRDFLVLTLVTGKRKGELESLSWDNVDFTNGTMTLPRTKTDKIDVVPMSEFVWMLLDSRRQLKGSDRHNRWVFPTHYTKGEHAGKHISNPYKALKKIEGFELSPHDLRRTFSTATRELGITKEDLSTLLNHSSRDVTEGYVFASLDHKRTNLESVEKFYNDQSNEALSYMKVHWYGGREELFFPNPEDDVPRVDYEKKYEHLLARNENKLIKGE